nr:hypothetical protein [Tanacetum cinerariifolium]
MSREEEAKFLQTFSKFDRLADKQSGRPSGSLPSNTQQNPQDNNSKAYQPLQSYNKHVKPVFTRSGKSYDPPNNPNDKQNETPINFDSDDEDEEPTPQPKTQPSKPVKETPLLKLYKPKIPYPQRLRKEKMEAQYGKFLDMIRAIRINYREDLDALLDEGSKILHSIEGTFIEEEIFFELDKFIAIIADENYDSESNTEEPPFEKIPINTDYKIKTSLEEPPTDIKLKLLLNNLEYVFLEEPSFLPVIISS